MQKTGDPVAGLPRNAVMMLDAGPCTIEDADPVVGGYALTGLTGGNRGRLLDKNASDTDWVALLLAVRDRADRAAFAQLFGHFAPRVKGFLMKSGASAALAEDCAQDVMATLWQKAHLYDPAKASVATWVFTIARNRRIDALRKSRRPEPEDLDWGSGEDEPDQAEVYEAQEEARGLVQALKVLPAPQRSLIERVYWGDLTHGEMAAETGLPLGTIKSRIRLALERLRREMAKE